jgi:hypothetical protein
MRTGADARYQRPVPNRDNLRKRAKSLVKQHRSGSYPVATRIRRALRRFAGLPDRAVLAEKFALSDALEVIARELGFADWPEAKKRMRQMAKRPDQQPDALKVLIAQPQILVSEVPRAASFYADMLGVSLSTPVARCALGSGSCTEGGAPS